ncbi:uncharacterized protein LOC128895702 isoform X1 [Hylaeus anthracinus]|uniref:uncharacterized protein LOC128895702 isoform X1 n=1 Tax=Hylaeus anthracinus TaxID=313031 RepID=UPI0023BA03C0|nr:uncharacterized protein LOC128895702 isoform X1 [Hylaeus anthracinus]
MRCVGRRENPRRLSLLAEPSRPMLKHSIGVCIFVCTIMFEPTLSKTAKTSKRNSDFLRRLQHEDGATKEKDFREELSATEVPSFGNRTSLKMLEDITAKVWRILPVIGVPRSWVLAYCMRYTEISEEVEKASMSCQHDGTDWDCVFIELVLGGGQDDFNVGKVVSLFHNLSNRDLRFKLLRGAEICGRLWQRYKQVQEKRLIGMRLSVRENSRRKRNLKKNRRTPGSKTRKHSRNKKKEDERDEELKKLRQATKEIKAIRRSLINKIAALENKKPLSPEEETELEKLQLTMAKKPSIEEYPITAERSELSRLEDVGSCLSRQAAKACESVVLDSVQKLV